MTARNYLPSMTRNTRRRLEERGVLFIKDPQLLDHTWLGQLTDQKGRVTGRMKESSSSLFLVMKI
jgi:hypothetical protein